MNALEVVRLLAGVAALLFVLEDWMLRPRLRKERAWATQRAELPWPFLFDRLYGERAVTFGLALRAAAAIGLLVSPSRWDLIVLMLGTWWWAVRWRGTFNGASDGMTLIVLLGLGLNAWRPEWAWGANVLIAGHLVVGFFVAGLAKLRSPEWRSGRAPADFAAEVGLTLPHSRLVALGVIAFELSFPLALVGKEIALVYVTLAVAFHIANAWIFGLNRFLLIWAAAYPALIAVASRSVTL